MKDKLLEIKVGGLIGTNGVSTLPLRDISIITGRNGAGKSRYMKMLNVISQLFLDSPNRKGDNNTHFSFCPLKVVLPKGLTYRGFDVSFMFELKEFPHNHLIVSTQYVLSNTSSNESDHYGFRAFSVSIQPHDNFFNSSLLFSFEIDNEKDIQSINSLKFHPKTIIDNIKIDWAESNKDSNLSGLKSGPPSFDDREDVDEFLNMTPEPDEFETEFKKRVVGLYRYVNLRESILRFDHKYLSKPALAEELRKLNNTLFSEENSDKCGSIELKTDKRYSSEFRTLHEIESECSIQFQYFFNLNGLLGCKEIMCLSILYGEYERASKLRSTWITSNINEANSIEKEVKNQFVSLLKGEFATVEEQVLIEELPEVINNLSDVIEKSIKRVETHDYSIMSGIQPELPSIIYDSFKRSKFRKVVKGTFIESFLSYWLAAFEIGDGLLLDSTSKYYEISILKGEDRVGLPDLSKGEKKIVYLLLAIATRIYPVTGFSTFKEVAYQLDSWIDSSVKIEKEIKDKYLSDLAGLRLMYSMYYKDDHIFDDSIYDKMINADLDVDGLLKFARSKSLYIEEPDAHLHPNSQSLLADLFVDIYYRFGIHLMIETHSEYLIRKLQFLVGSGILDKEDVLIGYMEKNAKSMLIDLDLQKDGAFRRNFGEGFLDEAVRWQFELLRVKNLN